MTVQTRRLIRTPEWQYSSITLQGKISSFDIIGLDRTIRQILDRAPVPSVLVSLAGVTGADDALLNLLVAQLRFQHDRLAQVGSSLAVIAPAEPLAGPFYRSATMMGLQVFASVEMAEMMMPPSASPTFATHDSDGLAFRIRRIDGRAFCAKMALIGVLNVTTVPLFDSAISARRAIGDHLFLLDLADLNGIDAAGVAELIAVTARVRDANGFLALCHAKGRVAPMLDDAAGSGDYLNVFSSAETAQMAVMSHPPMPIDLADYAPPLELVAALPKPIAQDFRVVPVQFLGDELIVAISPTSPLVGDSSRAAEILKIAAQRPVLLALADPHTFDVALETFIAARAEYGIDHDHDAFLSDSVTAAPATTALSTSSLTEAGRFFSAPVARDEPASEALRRETTAEEVHMFGGGRGGGGSARTRRRNDERELERSKGAELPISLDAGGSGYDSMAAPAAPQELPPPPPPSPAPAPAQPARKPAPTARPEASPKSPLPADGAPMPMPARPLPDAMDRLMAPPMAKKSAGPAGAAGAMVGALGGLAVAAGEAVGAAASAIASTATAKAKPASKSKKVAATALQSEDVSDQTRTRRADSAKDSVLENRKADTKPKLSASVDSRRGTKALGELRGLFDDAQAEEADIDDDYDDDEADEGGEALADILAGETLERETTVRFYKQMNPMTTVPLLVLLTKAKVKKIVMAHVGQSSGAGVQVKAANPVVTIVPRMPGCLVVPDRRDVDIRPENTEAQFFVTPLAPGNYRHARVEIWYEGKIIDTIETPTRVVTQFAARVTAIAGVLNPLIFGGLKAVGLDFDKQLNPDGAIMTVTRDYFAGSIVNFGIAAAGAGMLLAFGFYWLNRPRKADPVVQFMNWEAEEKTDTA